MDPATAISAALAAGAAAGLKDTAASAVKDAYSALRNVLATRYGNVDVTPVENKPDSSTKRDSLAEDLREAGVNQDSELLDLAKRLAAVLDEHVPEAGPRAGVKLSDVKAVNLTIQRVAGPVEGRGIDAKGDVTISDVGWPPEAPSPKS
jgi:hypothetical protein